MVAHESDETVILYQRNWDWCHCL